MSKSLKCYVAGSRSPSSFVQVAACFARSHWAARRMLWKMAPAIQDECDWDRRKLVVSRAPEHDRLIAVHGIRLAGVIHKTEIQRDMGWGCEGDARCEHCDRATFDGDYPLCDECGLCAECGHDEGCSNGV